MGRYECTIHKERLQENCERCIATEKKRRELGGRTLASRFWVLDGRLVVSSPDGRTSKETNVFAMMRGKHKDQARREGRIVSDEFEEEGK